MINTMPRERKPFQPNYDRWEPPSELFDALAEPGLRTRDRVELVIGFYACAHHGQGPWASEVARVLSIAKSNVERCMTELVAEHRAERAHGKFMLTPGKYSHPRVKFADEDHSVSAVAQAIERELNLLR